MTDPIERQDAIGVLEERLQANGYSNTVLVSELNRSIGYLMRLPPAQLKQGHWIEHKYAEEVNEMLISNYECSECHYWERYDSNFCPNCGARMEKGKTDEVEGRI